MSFINQLQSFKISAIFFHLIFQNLILMDKCNHMDKFILFHTRDNWFSWNSWKRYLKLSFSKFLIKSSKIKLINDYCQWMSIYFYYKSHVLYYIRWYNISVLPKFCNFLLYKMNIIFWKIVKFISYLICLSKIVNLRLCEQNLFIYFSYDNNLSLEHLL